MITLKHFTRNPWVMLGTVVGLALYYVLILRPLSQRAEALDKPLDDAWQELVDFSMESSSVRDLDLNQIKKTQETLRAALLATKEIRETVFTRVELEPEIRAKMNEPFFLIDFQNERQKRIEQLTSLANTQKVTLDADVLNGFPQYNAETKDPTALWAQLSLVHHVLTVAINSKVEQIKSVTMLPAPREATSNLAETSWQEIPLRIELVSTAPSAEKFLFAMPLRAEEMKVAGLPESLPAKPSLFLDRLLLRKQNPEKPNEISLDLVVSGFVPTKKNQLDRPQKKEVLR